jgi:site-specific DNA recombinase
VGYVRVSTQDQASRGLSIDAQRERIEGWAKLHDAELVGVAIDAGLSAASLERPGLSRALAALRAGHASALVVAKLDRLTRSVRDLGELLASHFVDKAGADLVSVAESIDTRSAAGRLVLNVLGSVAQWEREAIGERTRAALAIKKARAERVSGGVPYGWALASDGRALVPVASEREVMALAAQLYERGLSLRAVAATLATRGLVSRSGRSFDATQVARMLDALNREGDPDAIPEDGGACLGSLLRRGYDPCMLASYHAARAFARIPRVCRHSRENLR